MTQCPIMQKFAHNCPEFLLVLQQVVREVLWNKENVHPNISKFSYLFSILHLSLYLCFYCLEGRISMPANGAALKFSYKWVETPKMCIGVILPNNHPE